MFHGISLRAGLSASAGYGQTGKSVKFRIGLIGFNHKTFLIERHSDLNCPFKSCKVVDKIETETNKICQLEIKAASQVLGE